MDIQFTSDDGTVGPGHTMYEWSQIFIDAGEKMGRTFKIPNQSKRLIEEAGFVNVKEQRYKVPVGGWMSNKKWKEIGEWNLLYLTTGLEGMALYILKNVLGVSCSPKQPQFTAIQDNAKSTDHEQALLTRNSGIMSRSKL